MMTNAQTRKSPVQIYILMVLALIGVGLSVYLSQHYYQVRSGLAGFKSFCNLGEAMNCDVVAASRYAEVFAGIPLSGLATGWFLGIIAVATLGLGTAWRRVAGRVLIGMAALGLVASLFYLYVMFGLLHTYCLFCLLLDAVNVLIFAVALTLKPSATAPASASTEEESSAWKTLLGSVAACVFVAVVATKGMDTSEYKQADIDLVAQGALSSAPLPAGADDRYPSFGPKTASVTVVEFSDFQCPYCRMAAMQLNTVINRFPGKVRVVFRNFPLDPSCNPNMKHPGHAVACEAAKVAYCANQQSRFKEVYEEIFENQAGLKPGKPLEYAKKAGLDEAKLDACLKAPETQAAILADIEEAVRLRVESTPTLFINGHRVEGGMPLPAWDRVIEQLSK